MSRLLSILFLLSVGIVSAESENARKPLNENDLRGWLQNMVWYHQFSLEEMQQALGVSKETIQSALKKFNVSPSTKPSRPKDSPLLVLPYPGGRHPRIGFLDGAIRPQRETKVSVFTPWDSTSYVVADIPEAIWSNLGLTYLAHTHVPTIWTKNNVQLKKLEWNNKKDGTLQMERRLPNGIVFGTKVTPRKDHVLMKQWLTNGTKSTLTGLRVQNCVMLKGAKGFTQQTNENKLFLDAYAVCHSSDKKRWIITAWKPIHRAWGNVKCPCLHADPKFPDCAQGETKTLHGWLSFYEGEDIRKEIKRIENLNWWNE